MAIEVTRETFRLIFNPNSRVLDAEKDECFNKYHYYNKETDQRGFMLEDFVTISAQYYLTDINA